MLPAALVCIKGSSAAATLSQLVLCAHVRAGCGPRERRAACSSQRTERRVVVQCRARDGGCTDDVLHVARKEAQKWPWMQQ